MPTFYTSFGPGSHYRLEVDWSSSQDTTNNRSNVSVSAYLESDAGYDMSASATKSGTINIQGNSVGISKAGISTPGGQRILLGSHSAWVSHNGDGTGNVDISVSFAFNVTLSGTYYGTITATANDQGLPTIARASSVSSGIAWTAGTENLGISVARADGSFTHIADVYVYTPANQWAYIGGTSTKFATSTTLTWNTTHITRMYQALNLWESREAKIILYTYNSAGTHIGTTEKTGGVCRGINPGYISFSNFNIGSSVNATIHNHNSSFVYDVSFVFGNYSTTLYGQGASPSFTLDAASMYAQVPNSNSGWGTATVSTYYNGAGTKVLINEAIPSTFYAYVTNSNPTFSASFSYADQNTTTRSITGNAAYIIEGKSSVLVTIPYANRALTKNGAGSISEYIATLNGVEIRKPYADHGTSAAVTFNFGAVYASSNVTLTIKAVDSRGNSTSPQITVLMLPYKAPVLDASVTRADNFGETTTLRLSGSLSTLTIGTANKNSVQLLQYRYKASSTTTWGAWTNFSYTTSGASFTATNVTFTFDVFTSYNFEVQVKDGAMVSTTQYLLSTTSDSLLLGVGQPIMFIDSVKKSVGINRFPQFSNTFEVDTSMWMFPDNVASAPLAAIFTGGDTNKSTINFKAANGSNDPGAIIHETSTISTDINKGVLHLMPSDDNDNINDYVTIHGTNDPETIRLYTGGNAEFPGTVYAGMVDFQNGLLIAANGGAGNIDHIWHDDTNNIWHFVSDGAAKARGNSMLAVGSVNASGALTNGAFDFYLGTNDQSSRGNTGASRALVKNGGGVLTINYGGDFYGGVDVNSHLKADRFISDGGNGALWAGWHQVFTISNGSYGMIDNTTGGNGIGIHSNGTIYLADNVGQWYFSSFNGDNALINTDITIGNARTIIWNVPGNFDQLWFNDSDNQYHFTADTPTSKTTGQGYIRCGGVNAVSDRKAKTNISDYDEVFGATALDKVKQTKAKTYSYIHNLETMSRGRIAPERSIGVIADEVPPEILGVDGESIDLYAMITVAWRSIQQLGEQVDLLAKKLKNR